VAYREVSVFEIREVLRLWMGGQGFRAVTRLSGVDRKTVAKYTTDTPRRLHRYDACSTAPSSQAWL